MTAAKRNILFVHNYPTTFVQLDLKLLREEFAVTEVYLRPSPFHFADLYPAVQKHDLVFGWFASWHTFPAVALARLLNKPSVLVIGGYDLANLPAIGYGHQRGGAKKWISRWTMRMATQLVTNSYYSQQEAEKNAGIPRERVRVIYHGVPDPFGSLDGQPREQMALTVGNVDTSNLWRKGHEPFVRAAGLLPDVQFVLVGEWNDRAVDHLRAIAPKNVTFTGKLAAGDLLSLYRRAAVYVQASAHEGFGMSVAEAMLGGCIPVTTRSGSLPEVAGEIGCFIDQQTPDAIANGISQGFAAQETDRDQCRMRILKEFSIETRQKEIRKMINSLFQESPYQNAN